MGRTDRARGSAARTRLRRRHVRRPAIRAGLGAELVRQSVEAAPATRAGSARNRARSSNAKGQAGITYELDTTRHIKLCVRKPTSPRRRFSTDVQRFALGRERRDLAREKRASQLLLMMGRCKVHAQERQLRRQPAGPKRRQFPILDPSRPSGVRNRAALMEWSEGKAQTAGCTGLRKSVKAADGGVVLIRSNSGTKWR